MVHYIKTDSHRDVILIEHNCKDFTWVDLIISGPCGIMSQRYKPEELDELIEALDEMKEHREKQAEDDGV